MNLQPGAQTDDKLFNGRLACRQFKEGYRFSVDAVLAASFCAPLREETVLDLGCGCGIIGLILAFRCPKVRVTGLEIQPELAGLTRQNILSNNYSCRMSVVTGDLCTVQEFIDPESFDLVVSNPPYRNPGSGRLSNGGQRARARHEIDANLHDIVRAASFAVRNKGRVVMIYPASRSATLIAAFKTARLEPKRIQPVFAYPEAAEAGLVLIDALKNGGEGVTIMEPLYIYSFPGGPLSESVKSLYD